MGLRFFSSEANSSYMLLEQQLTQVSSSIDSLFVRLYATPSLREDFMQFFISTPSEYTAYRLERGGSEDSFLDECSALVSETDFCITHILYDSGERIADMEYSREGYSRWRSVSAQEAEGFTKGPPDGGAGRRIRRQRYLCHRPGGAGVRLLLRRRHGRGRAGSGRRAHRGGGTRSGSRMWTGTAWSAPARGAGLHARRRRRVLLRAQLLALWATRWSPPRPGSSI